MPSPPRRTWAALAVVALLAVIVRLAWVGDDAYITLRAVENLLAGRGLVWNTGERVQAYTHPAWMLLLALGRALTGECYFTTIALGCLASAFAAWLLLAVAGSARAVVVVAVLLASSRAFTEYSTSGLENPLSHALLAALVVTAWRDGDADRRCARAAWLAALLACTRMDLAVLAAPLVIAAARGLPWRACVRHGALGASPLVAWLAFATVYYGTPFPITAYAKLFAHGVPTGELAAQGLCYFAASAASDPATTAVLAAGVALGALRPELRSRWLALGVVAYCAYVVKIGGDFMTGRFLTPPFVVAAAILARWLGTASARGAWLTAGASVGAMLVGGVPAWWRAPANEPPPPAAWHGIVDERANYVTTLGCWSAARSVPVAGVASAAMRQAGLGPVVITWGQVGRYAFEAGDLVHVCDPWLLDPLLMRLPLADPAAWTIGHFARRIPEGYLESLATGENRVHDPALRRVYERVRCVVGEPVGVAARLRAAWELSFGAGAAELRAYAADGYRSPPRLALDAGELAPPVPLGSHWFREPRTRVVYAGGLAVRLAAPTTAARLRVRVAGLAPYTFRLRRDGVEVASLRLEPTQRWELGLQQYELVVPPAAGAFDCVWVDGATGYDSIACLGGLEPLP